MLGAENVNTRSVLLNIEAELKVISDIAWKEKLNATSAIRGNAQGGNKLRTYSKFKHEYGTEPYVTIITRKCYRSACAKFRCGVALIKLEACRYGLNTGAPNSAKFRGGCSFDKGGLQTIFNFYGIKISTF